MDSTAFLPSFFKMLFALAVVLGLLIGAMYIFKNFMHRTASGGNDGSAINIVAARYLGPKNSLVLVEVLGKIMVLGLTNNHITHLTDISEPDAPAKLKEIEKRGKTIPSFSDYLKRNKIALRIFDNIGKEHPRK